MKIALCFYGKFTGKNNRGEIQGFDIPFDYLKKNVDFKWTLETVIKYAEEIDNLSPPAKKGLGEFIIK